MRVSIPCPACQQPIICQRVMTPTHVVWTFPNSCPNPACQIGTFRGIGDLTFETASLTTADVAFLKSLKIEPDAIS